MLICPLCRLSGGELFDRLVAEDYDLKESDCITYMRQICQGVQHIHGNNIIHLDLKVCPSSDSPSFFVCFLQHVLTVLGRFLSNEHVQIPTLTRRKNLKKETREGTNHVWHPCVFMRQSDIVQCIAPKKPFTLLWDMTPHPHPDNNKKGRRKKERD